MPPSSTPSDPNHLLATVQQTLADHHMLIAGDRVLVGVSGGPDSMVLLHLLSRLAPAMGISLGVAHLNHCLRGASAERDAQTVCRAASDFGHPCHMGRAQVMKVKKQLGLSLEEAARRVRYAFFNKTMTRAGYNKLALGHQLDDNAEQMLMALLRGAGPRGLSGIAPIRQNRIIRPMIQVRRSQIEAYAANAGICCVTDESNTDLRFLRNRIRHRLLPELESAYNPRMKDHLSRLADVMHTEEAWIDGLISAPYEKAVIDRGKDSLTLCVPTMRQTHPALARRLVRRTLQDLTGSLRKITFAHVQSVLCLLEDSGHGKALHLPGGVRVRRKSDQLVLKASMAHIRGSAAKPLDVETGPVAETVIPPPFPSSVKIQPLGIGMHFFACRPDQLPRWRDISQRQAFFDADRLSPPFRLRPPVPGDRFTPLGTAGSQKLKKFFIDHHISRKDRGLAPVMLDQHRIIWLVGRRIDDHVKVTSATTHVLSVDYFLLDNR